MAPDDGGRFEVGEEFLFVGRTFAEYRRMFGLDAGALTGTSVLDCGGGPSPFAAVAAQVGADATAVDPMYERSLDTLERRARDGIERNVEQLREKRDLFVWDEYGDVETRGRYLRAAAERFLADYARHPERYVAAGVPALPFDDGVFDLALSANFLFLYDDRLTVDDHLASLRELARVADEVRVFPLASLDRQRSAFVAPVVERLRADGYRVGLREVPYEFQPGATTTLVVGGG